MPNLIPGYTSIPPLQAAHTFNEWKDKTNLIITDLGILAAAQVITAAVTVNEAFAKSVIDYVPPAYIVTGKLATNAAMDNISTGSLSGSKLTNASVPFGKLDSSTMTGSITNAMLGLTDNLLSGAKLLDASVPIAKLSYTNNAIDGVILTRKTVYVNKMYATRESVLFGLGKLDGSWSQAAAEAAELKIGAGLYSYSNSAPASGTADTVVRSGRIYWKPNISFTSRSEPITITSSWSGAQFSTLTNEFSGGISPNYLNGNGYITQGTAATTSRLDFISLLSTKITGLNSSYYLITVTIQGSVQSNYGNYGFKLYKTYNTLTTPVQLHTGYTWYTDEGTTRNTSCTFSFLDTAQISSGTITTSGSADGTSIENPATVYDIYSTIVYHIRYISASNNGPKFWLNYYGAPPTGAVGTGVSSMTVQEMPQ